MFGVGVGIVVVLLLLLLLVVEGGAAVAVGVAVAKSCSGLSFHTTLICCFGGGVGSSFELLLEVYEGSGAMRRRVSKKRRMQA